MQIRFLTTARKKISQASLAIRSIFKKQSSSHQLKSTQALSLKTHLQNLWSTYHKSLQNRPKTHLAVLGSLILIIALIPILGSIKHSQTSQAVGLQIQSISPRIGAPAGGDKVIIKGQDFQKAGGLKQITAGYSHTCALGSNGNAYCWGGNNYGHLGNNSTTNSSTPVAVVQGAIPGGVNLTHILAGNSHTCALGSNSQAYCWGNGNSGRLGNNSTTDSSTPVAVSQGQIPSVLT